MSYKTADSIDDPFGRDMVPIDIPDPTSCLDIDPDPLGLRIPKTVSREPSICLESVEPEYSLKEIMSEMIDQQLNYDEDDQSEVRENNGHGEDDQDKESFEEKLIE